MARESSNKVDFFGHVVKHGRTLTILESEFGNDGYAFWFKLLELLGDTENHYYCTAGDMEWKFLVSKMRIPSEKCVQILSLCASLDAIDRELWSVGVIWSENFVAGVKRVYDKRRRPLPSRPDPKKFSVNLRISGTEIGAQPSFSAQADPEKASKDAVEYVFGPETPHSRVKESREEESTAKRGVAATVEEIGKLEFVLRLHNSEFDKYVLRVREAIRAEIASRGSRSPFTWPDTTGGLESDLRKLIYGARQLGITDDVKRSILYDVYKLNGEKLNWPTYVLMCIEITMVKSRRSPIREPYKFIASQLLKKPNEVITAYSDGALKSVPHVFREAHDGK